MKLHGLVALVTVQVEDWSSVSASEACPHCPTISKDAATVVVIIKLLRMKSFNYYIHWRNSISSPGRTRYPQGRVCSV